MLKTQIYIIRYIFCQEGNRFLSEMFHINTENHVLVPVPTRTHLNPSRSTYTDQLLPCCHALKNINDGPFIILDLLTSIYRTDTNAFIELLIYLIVS